MILSGEKKTCGRKELGWKLLPFALELGVFLEEGKKSEALCSVDIGGK